MTITTLNTIDTISSGIGMAHAINQGMQVLMDPTAFLSQYSAQLDPSIYNSPDFKSGLEALKKNLPKIVRKVARYKSKVIAGYLSQARFGKSTLVFYLPTPGVKTPSFLLPTGVRVPFPKAGSVPVAMKVGGRYGRFFGVGFTEGLSTNKEHQLFRMDHAIYGSHYAGDPSNLDY